MSDKIERMARVMASVEYHTNPTHPETCYLYSMKYIGQNEPSKCPCEERWEEYVDDARGLRRFVLVSKTEPCPVNVETGLVTNLGALNEISAENVYFRAYARWPKGKKWESLFDLEVGEVLEGVGFALSGVRVTHYNIWRVR